MLVEFNIQRDIHIQRKVTTICVMSLEPKQLKTNFNLWIKKLTSTAD